MTINQYIGKKVRVCIHLESSYFHIAGTMRKDGDEYIVEQGKNIAKFSEFAEIKNGLITL